MCRIDLLWDFELRKCEFRAERGGIEGVSQLAAPCLTPHAYCFGAHDGTPPCVHFIFAVATQALETFLSRGRTNCLECAIF